MGNKDKRVLRTGGTVTLKVTCLLNPEEHERYVSRLRWICYAIVRKQCRAILYHTTMAERLLATYESKLALSKDTDEMKFTTIERKLFEGLYELKGITERRVDDILAKLRKRAKVLESAAKELSRELKDEMLRYDPSNWGNKDYIEPQFTPIEWHDLLSVIAMEEALFAINQGYCSLSENINQDADEYARTIKTYLGVFTNKGWSPDAFDDEDKFNSNASTVKSPKNIRAKKFQLVKQRIDKFIEPNFTKALKKAIPKRDIVKYVYEKKYQTIFANNIKPLLRLYGYEDKDMEMGWLKEQGIPIFLVHASNELFNEVFPIEHYDDCDLMPFTEDNFYSQLIIPHEESWFQALLSLPYREDLVGSNLYNVKIMEQVLTTALHEKGIAAAESIIKQREKDLQTVEEYVRQDLLPDLYLDYPELEEYLHGIADGDAECIRRWPAAVGAVLNGSGAAAAAAS